MTLRKIVFWTHLCLGVVAALVILVMSGTGVILAYDLQLNQWARGNYRADPAVGAEPLPIPNLLTAVTRAESEIIPTAVHLSADPRDPVIVDKEGGGRRFVDRYTGEILGNGETRMGSFMRTVEHMHRWLTLDGANRSIARAVTGACNLVFVFLVVSGIYLWIPATWTRRNFRKILWFRTGLSAKARDFNWHNVIGFWTCIPLVIIVLTGVVFSYSWAGDLVRRLAGDDRDRRPSREPSAEAVVAQDPPPAPVDLAILESLIRRSSASTPGWRSLTVSVPRVVTDPVTITTDRGNGRQPQKRASVVYDSQTGEETGRREFSDAPRSRRWGAWIRFVHTGEYYGLVGQTIAALASLGACFLVYTGLALGWRRAVAWLRRRSVPSLRLGRRD